MAGQRGREKRKPTYRLGVCVLVEIETTSYFSGTERERDRARYLSAIIDDKKNQPMIEQRGARAEAALGVWWLTITERQGGVIGTGKILLPWQQNKAKEWKKIRKKILQDAKLEPKIGREKDKLVE